MTTAAVADAANSHTRRNQLYVENRVAFGTVSFPEIVIVPVSQIEFVPESSVYWPIVGLGTRVCGVAKRLRDPAVQSEILPLCLASQNI